MRGKSWFILMVALCLASVPAAASTFVHMPQHELVANTDALVQGKVIDLRSSWNESGQIIITEAVVAVEETLLGQSVPATVTVRTAGGQVGDFRVEAHGFPQFELGERVLLFLEDGENATMRVVGYQQGHYRVVERLDGVTLAVPQIEDGARFFTPSGQLAPAARSIEINTFKNIVRSTALEVGRSLTTE